MIILEFGTFSTLIWDITLNIMIFQLVLGITFLKYEPLLLNIMKDCPITPATLMLLKNLCLMIISICITELYVFQRVGKNKRKINDNK